MLKNVWQNFVIVRQNCANVWQKKVIAWQNCANVWQNFVNCHIFLLSGKIVSVFCINILYQRI